jgi:uncharacterized protein YkwD
MAETPTALESYFLELVNNLRAAEGVLPLTFDAELMNAADDHNAWMDANDTLSHTGANGSTIPQRIADAGYDATAWSENIWNEWGTDETGATAGATEYFVEKSYNWFLNSPAHYQAMINSDYQDVGISFMAGTYQGYPAAYTTIKFAAPTEAEAAENAGIGLPVAEDTPEGELIDFIA